MYVKDVKRSLMPDLSNEIDNIVVLWSVMGLIVGSFSIFIIIKYMSKDKK